MSTDESEREQTINAHRYLCVRAARKFMRDGLDRRDLEQVAAIGLIKATDRFDARLGTPFEAYAWTFVLGELMHYVRDGERMMRVPRRIRDLERRCAAVERTLCNELGREASAEELICRLEISDVDFQEIRKFRDERVMLSVDALRPSDQGRLSYTMDRQLDRMVLEAGLSRLSRLEREIVQEIYQNDTPVSDLAKKLGYSRRHVTRLHRGALKKLLPLRGPVSA